MKHKFTKLREHPKYSNVLNWIKLISVTGSAQIIVQAVGFLSGLLVIRLLPVEEYGLYTLSNTMLGTMTLLADGGISAGVMAQGGKVWQDEKKLGKVLATGLFLRRRFAVGSFIVAIPILIYLLNHHGASWLTTLLIVASLIPAFFAALSDSLLEIVPKLHQDIMPLQKNQVAVGLGRLLLTGLIVFIFPFTFFAILAAGVPRIWGNIKLRKIANAFIDKDQLPDPDVQKDILKVVQRVMPGAIFYTFAGQISIWLISIFGNTTSVAQLGALNRFAVLLSLVSMLIGTLIIPRFARLPEIRAILLKRLLQIMVVVIVAMLLIVGFVYLFSNQLLWILGSNYEHLQTELVLAVTDSCLGLIAGVIFSLCTARGWIIHPAILIISNVCAIIGFAFILDVSTLYGVLVFNIGTALISILTIVIYVAFIMRKLSGTKIST